MLSECAGATAFGVDEHWVDTNGNPAGGVSSGVGYTISWQNGPLGRHPDRKAPNGAFVESVLQALISRLDFYQQSKFACDENAAAREHLSQALAILAERTRRREAAKTEGTHQGN